MKGLKARLAFFRSALATRRWSFLKYAWLLLGAYDLILSQLIPKSVGDSFPKTYEALTSAAEYISWQAWAGAGIAILVLASLEYSFRRTAPVLALSPVSPEAQKPSVDHQLSATPAVRPSVAVLPFVNVSNDPEQEYFADGMADVLIGALSKLRWLHVISRNSSFTYKGKTTGHTAIRDELKVRYLVEGTVAKAGGRMRITASLIDAVSGVTLWNNKFDRDYKEIFELQDEVVRLVVAAIEPNIRTTEIQRAHTKPTQSLDAYDHYLRALAGSNAFTREGFASALKELDAAIKLDPLFAQAWSLKADVTGRMVNFGWRERSEGESETLSLIDRAIQLDSEDGHALSIGAWAYYSFGADLTKAIGFAKRALVLHPNSPSVIANTAWPLIGYGESGEALTHLAAAREIDPLDPRSFLNYLAVSAAHFFAKRFPEALAAADESLARAPKGAIVPRTFRAAALFHLGRLEEARAQISEALALNPKLSTENTLRIPHRYPWMKELIVGAHRASGVPDKAHEMEANPAAKASIAARTEAPSIAVLPFTNLSGDADQEYFADGITEDIINALTRFRWLQVIGRASSFTFKGKGTDPSAVAKELGASYVLTGSVRKSGGKIRVAAQLVDAGTRAQIWSSHFDGDLSDVFKVQDELTEKVVAAIEPALKSEEIRRSLAKGTSNLAAYDYYLRALSKAHLFSEDALREVEKHLRKAIELDATFADAYAWLCLILTKIVVGGWSRNADSENDQSNAAVVAGSRALELDPENGAALAHTAFAKAAFEGALDHAADLARKALVVQPNSPTTLAACGWTLIYNGDIDVALDCLQKAHRLNPVDPGGYRTINGIALAYILKRDFATAETWSLRSIALSPLQPVALRMRAIILAYQGRFEEARDIGGKLRVEQRHYHLANSLRHQWMRDLVVEGMRLAAIPES